MVHLFTSTRSDSTSKQKGRRAGESGNEVDKCATAMENQLGINVNSRFANETYFETVAEGLAKERTDLRFTDGTTETVLTHDTIATLFFQTVMIKRAQKGTFYL